MTARPARYRTKSGEHYLRRVRLQKDRELEEAYHISSTPNAAIARSAGTVGSSVGAGHDMIRAALRQLLLLLASPPVAPLVQGPVAAAGWNVGSSTARNERSRTGEPAPPVASRDLTGETVGLTDFLGRKIVVLFRRSGYGFCQQMLPSLKSWEANAPQRAPMLLVIFPGSVGGNQVVNFHSPPAIDRDSSGARAFGAGGAAVAVLVDARGRIAPEITAGAGSALGPVGCGHEPTTSGNRSGR